MKQSTLTKLTLVLAVVAIVISAVALITRFAGGGNPWVFQMSNPSVDGLRIVGVSHSTTNIETWLDAKGVPIAAVGQVGGIKVFGDNIGVNPPGNVYRSSVVLHAKGGVTVAMNGPTLYGGSSVPTRSCKTGDFYFRQSLIPGQRVYQCNAGRWGAIL